MPLAARPTRTTGSAADANYGEKTMDFKTETQLRQEIADAWRLVDQHKRAADIYAAERDHARACYDRTVRILTGIPASLDDVLRLREQLAAAQKDAERYRWLRVQDNDDLRFAVLDEAHWRGAGDCDPYFFGTPEELDAAIDNEMKGEK
mgnify:FL=1